jgi:hypothetical protein
MKFPAQPFEAHAVGPTTASILRARGFSVSPFKDARPRTPPAGADAGCFPASKANHLRDEDSAPAEPFFRIAGIPPVVARRDDAPVPVSFRTRWSLL